MLTKVTKKQQEQVTSKETNLSKIRFCRALDNSKQDVTTYCGVPALFYLSYCNGLLNILQRVQICSVRCTSEC